MADNWRIRRQTPERTHRQPERKDGQGQKWLNSWLRRTRVWRAWSWASHQMRAIENRDSFRPYNQYSLWRHHKTWGKLWDNGEFYQGGFGAKPGLELRAKGARITKAKDRIKQEKVKGGVRAKLVMTRLWEKGYKGQEQEGDHSYSVEDIDKV